MLDQDFCETLEYKLCGVFENLNDEDLKDFWCEGVLLTEPEEYYSQKFVNDNRKVRMQVFVGKDGQTAYRLTLHFGNKALSRYARNLSIIECIPQTDYENWFKIDTSTKQIEMQLD